MGETDLPDSWQLEITSAYGRRKTTYNYLLGELSILN